MKSLILLATLLFSLNSFARDNRMGISNQIFPTATVTSTQILSQNLNRNYLMIQNNGATSIIVKYSSVQAGTEGVSIPAGGNWEPLIVPGDSVWIRSASSTDAMTIIEGINP